MPKFVVELWLDGFEDEQAMTEACEEFIYENLNSSGSSVKIIRIVDDRYDKELSE